MEQTRALLILDRLKKCFPNLRSPNFFRDPFQGLILTVLSQHTNDRNSWEAFRRLSNRLPITPKDLFGADEREIQEAIRVAGLFRNKSKTMKKLAEEVLKRFGGDIGFVFDLPMDEARRTLQTLPGVGPKTADVVLLFHGRVPLIPIDTHIFRVSKRLGFYRDDPGYDHVRLSIERLYPKEEYLTVHLSLISLGRAFCKARNPICPRCPLEDLCDYRMEQLRARIKGTL